MGPNPARQSTRYSAVCIFPGCRTWLLQLQRSLWGHAGASVLWCGLSMVLSCLKGWLCGTLSGSNRCSHLPEPAGPSIRTQALCCILSVGAEQILVQGLLDPCDKVIGIHEQMYLLLFLPLAFCKSSITLLCHTALQICFQNAAFFLQRSFPVLSKISQSPRLCSWQSLQHVYNALHNLAMR